MKVILIIFGILLAVFAIFQFFVSRSSKNIETYPYSLIKKFDRFEIRKYEASLFTSVKLTTNEYKQASNRGFSILANYIFGGNDKNEKIAMTSPVAMSMEDSMTMMFMVPRHIKREDLPKPNQSQIQFQEEPVKTVAAISFGGWANDEKLEKYKKKLIAALEEKGLDYTSPFYFLGYNPPYAFFNRKNEIIVELRE